MQLSNKTKGPWSIGTYINEEEKEYYTLFNRDGEPIWPIGIGRLNVENMVKNEEPKWWQKLMPATSRNQQYLGDIVNRAGFEFGSDNSSATMNNYIPTLYNPPSIVHAALGKYMSHREHQKLYYGEPYNHKTGRGRIPLDVGKLAEEVKSALSEFPETPGIVFVEYLWGVSLWNINDYNGLREGVNWNVALKELTDAVNTIKVVAPWYPIIWSHALTKCKDKGIWTEEHQKEAFAAFYEAGGNLIGQNWYTDKKYTPANAYKKNNSIRDLKDSPTGVMEFSNLPAEEFFEESESSPRGRRALERAKAKHYKNPSSYSYPTVKTREEQLEKLEETLMACARNPKCLLASPYSAEDHDLSAWGYCFNPYTWEEYDLERINDILQRVRTYRKERMKINYTNCEV